MEKSFLGKLGKDTILYIPSKLVPGITGFVSLMIYTRLLTPEEYGRYTLVFTIVSLLAKFCFSWLEQSVLRYYEKYESENENSEFYSTVFVVTILLSIFVSFIFFLATYFLFNFSIQVQFLLNIAAILLPIKVIYKMLKQIFRSKREATYYSIISSLQKLIYLPIMFGLIYFVGFREESLMIAMIISYIGLIIHQFYKLIKLEKFELSIAFLNKKIIKEFLQYGSPWIGIALASFMLNRFDRYVIEYFLTTDQVGLYTATYSLAEKSIMQFASLLTISSLPVLINEYVNAEEDKSTFMMKNLLRVYITIFIPAVFGLVYLSDNIITIILGEEFQGANFVFIIISIGAFFEALRNLVGRPFQLKEKTKYLPLLLIISGVINIALNFLLVPIMGINGAAIATLIGFMFYFILGYIISSRFFVWDIPLGTLGKSFISSLIMILFLSLIPFKIEQSIILLILHVVFGVFVFFLVLFVLKEELITKFISDLR